MHSARALTELFHLVFTRALFAGSSDQDLFAVKGGAALRFWFASPRYSEDIDFDVATLARGTLANKVDRLLRAPVVTAPLARHGVELVDISAPKQTETTQRWKVGLRAAGLPSVLRTKIEFSRRGAIEGTVQEPVGEGVVRSWALPPFLGRHYSAPHAIRQKIEALAGRPATQARDLFDLHLLLARPDGRIDPLVDRERLRVAIDRAVGIGFDEHAAGVVAFLEPDHAALYRDSASFDAMQDAVIGRLEAAGR
jgi:hypothetical protein